MSERCPGKCSCTVGCALSLGHDSDHSCIAPVVERAAKAPGGVQWSLSASFDFAKAAESTMASMQQNTIEWERARRGDDEWSLSPFAIAERRARVLAEELERERATSEALRRCIALENRQRTSQT